MTKTALNKTEYNRNPGGVATGLALTMAWQLAVVVVFPITGGYMIDTSLNTSPVFTVVGFAIAMGGMLVVVSRTVEALNKALNPDPSESDKDKHDA